MLLLPASAQKASNKIYSLIAPSSFVWRGLVKNETPYSTPKGRFELKTNDLSHLGNTYVLRCLVELTATLLKMRGWGVMSCSRIPLTTCKLQSLLPTTYWAQKKHKQFQQLKHTLRCGNCTNPQRCPLWPPLIASNCPMTALHSGMGMAFHPVKSSCLSPFFVSSQDPVRPDLCSCSFVMEEKIKNNKKKALCFLYCYFLQVHRGDNLFCSAMQNFTNLNWPDYLSNCIIVSTTES